jgi:hypothetical protein
MRWAMILFLLSAPALGADPTVDWLMKQATTGPSSQPATQPTAIFKAEDDASRAGVITMSDGSTVSGKIATTAEKPVRVWDENEKEYKDVPFSMIKSIEAEVLWERDEQEWHFKASGSDVKEYSGKTYPARETKYKLTLTNGESVEGGVVAPLFVGDKTYVLHKRDKGDVGQTLSQLIYVKSVTFSD